jgi:hypothetical protein
MSETIPPNGIYSSAAELASDEISIRNEKWTKKLFELFNVIQMYFENK